MPLFSSSLVYFNIQYAHAVAECPELSDANGNFNYSNNQLVGSMATLTCNTGFEVNGTNPVTCESSEEWTGMPFCEGKKFISGRYSNAGLGLGFY